MVANPLLVTDILISDMFFDAHHSPISNSCNNVIVIKCFIHVVMKVMKDHGGEMIQ